VIELLEAISEVRWLLAEQADLNVLPLFLTLVILWLSLQFASFGLFERRKATVVALHIPRRRSLVRFLMILELGTSPQGLVRRPIAPLVGAAEQLKAGEGAVAAPHPLGKICFDHEATTTSGGCQTP
jgi:hypothetical protein